MNAPLLISYIIAILAMLYLIYREDIRALSVRNQEFKCTHCGKCCKYRVKLSEKDIRRMKRAGLTDFVTQKNTKKWLKQNNGWCKYHTFKKGKSHCMIYEFRPDICRRFPRIKVWGKNTYDLRCEALTVPGFLKKF